MALSYFGGDSESFLQRVAQAPVFFGCPDSDPKEVFIKALKIVANSNGYAVLEQTLRQQPGIESFVINLY
jgi:hypothetical protein